MSTGDALEIWRHGRRPCVDATTMKEPTSTICDSKMQESGDYTMPSCTAKAIPASVPALTVTRQKKMNNSFCGIFGTDMELMQ